MKYLQQVVDCNQNNLNGVFDAKFEGYHQKQPSRGVLRKRCSENMQQIYRVTFMPKCDFNKVAKQLHILALQQNPYFFLPLYKSGRPEVFCKKDVLRNFTKFTGKQLCQGLFYNKVAGLQLY